MMESTESSVSISMSKHAPDEEMSMSFGSMQDASARMADALKNESISNERISRSTPLLDTYMVMSDPIEGGMGSVYRVHHMAWDMDLAMKRPKARFFAEAGSARRKNFIEECDYWIRLGLHPNIVSCYYVREIGGVPTIFSEWMDGGSLKDRIRDGSLYEGSEEEVAERVLNAAVQAARGLKYSHESGLIHADVKPGNILLTKNWNVKVADFGIARAAADREEESTGSGTGKPAGSGGYTPEYCPAEQASGQEPERWMDVYAFALTVLEMYAGKRLWKTGADVRDGADAYLRGPGFRVRMPEAVQALLNTCLTERPDGFAGIEAALLDIYRRETGLPYPKDEAKAASDTPDSLNNRALSFLDLGQPEESLRLWERALYAAPDHVPSFYNRELYFLRSGQKADYRVLEALDQDEACRRADAAADIFGEWDRTHPLLPPPVAFEIEGSATDAVLTDEHILFTFNDSNSFGGDRNPCICRVRREGSGGGEKDELQDIISLKSPIVKIAVRPGREEAAVLLEDGTLCLYDTREHRLLRAVRTLPEDTLEAVFGSLFYLKFAWSRKGHILAFYNEKLRNGTVMVEMPSMRVIGGTGKHFCAFSPDDLPLVLGRAAGGSHALFEVDLSGREREVYRFGSDPKQYIEFCQSQKELRGMYYFRFAEYGRSGVTDEDFYLDREYMKHPVDNAPGTVLFHDPGKGLIYTLTDPKIGSGRADLIEVKDSRTMNRIFSVRTEKITGVLEDPDGTRVVTWRVQDGRTSWSAAAPLPSVHQNRPAAYRLSEIVTEEKRSEEDDRLARLLDSFRRADEAGDTDTALGILRESREIPGFHGSPAAVGMEERADAIAEKYALKTVRQLPDRKGLPQFFYLGKAWRRCRDGLIAVYSPTLLGESDDVELYSPDGTLVRKIRLPSFSHNVRVKGDRIFTWISATLHAAVYDLEGNLLHSSPAGWPPPPDRISDSRSPKIMDLDSTGRYVLFGMAKKNTEGSSPVSGIFELDYDTGNVIRLADYGERHDKYSGYGYFDDDTFVIRTGSTLSRFEKGTGRKLMSYRISNPEGAPFSVSMNPARDRFFLAIVPSSGNVEMLYAFHRDGEELYFEHEKKITLSSVWWYPDDRFVCMYGGTGFRILDMETGARPFSADEYYSYYYTFHFSPDGRMIYVERDRGDKKRVNTYELEFAYKPRGTADPEGAAGEAALITEDEPLPPGAPGNAAPAGAGREDVPGGGKTPVRLEVRAVSGADGAVSDGEEAEKTPPAAVEYDKTVLRADDPACPGNESSIVIPDGIRRIGTECFSMRASLRKVIIPEGVTEIGSRAFLGCMNLESVSIPTTLKKVGREAFRGCAKLRKITLPPGLEDPGAYAFSGCASLERVEIGEGPVRIRDGLFSECGALASVSLPDGLLEIGEFAFSECGSLKALSIPDTVYSIRENAFFRSLSFRSVKLPADLREIGYRMFWKMGRLERIDIPDRVGEIGNEAFSECGGLASVRFPAALRKIGRSAFGGCSSLSEIVLPPGCAEIGDWAFYGCESAVSAVLPESLASLGESAFYKCRSLKTLRLPGELMSIGKEAFKECTGLEEVVMSGRTREIGDGAFSGCEALSSVTLADGITGIGHYAFRGCGSLERIHLPETLESIGINAFCRSALSGEIRIPGRVSVIREGAFSFCGSLDAFVLEEGSTVCEARDGVLFSGDKLAAFPAGRKGSYSVPEGIQSIGKSAFGGCRGLTEIRLPGSLAVIESSAFEGCSGLTSVRIPARTGDISGDAFSGCSGILAFEVEEGNERFISPDGILMSADGKELLAFPPARGGEYTLPGSVRVIGPAFASGKSDLTVIIRNGDVRIDWNSFRTDGSLRVQCPKDTPLYEKLTRNKVPVTGAFEAPKEKEQALRGLLKRLFTKRGK